MTIDLLKLAIKIHLILSFSLIFELCFLGIKKIGFRRFFRELKDDNFWYVIVVLLTSPYQIILIGFVLIGKKMAEIIDKVKKMTTESDVKDE